MTIDNLPKDPPTPTEERYRKEVGSLAKATTKIFEERLNDWDKGNKSPLHNVEQMVNGLDVVVKALKEIFKKLEKEALFPTANKE